MERKKELPNQNEENGNSAEITVVKASKRSKKGAKNRVYKQVKLEPSIYSLYTYYKTLPKEIQEHPGVKTTYLGL